MIKNLKTINTYTICDGTNNPDAPGTRPYAVIYKATFLVVRRGSDSLSERTNFFEGLAYYAGNGKWIDHNAGYPCGLIESEGPDAAYDECVESSDIDEFNDSHSGKDDYAIKFRYTVYAYYPLPEYPENIKVILAGGDDEEEKLAQQIGS